MIRLFASSHVDQMHRLQWALFQAEAAKGPRVVQMTASRFGEGVTTVTLGLAASMARLFGPESTVVVEANLRKPSFHEVLGVIPKVPIINLLETGLGFLDAVVKIENYGFSVLSAGATPMESGHGGPETYLENLGKLFEDLGSRYKFILVDSPPVLPFVDSDIVAGTADSVVIVVEANSTKAEVLDVTINRLKAVEAQIAGLILNKRVFYIPRWLYRFL
ncbi:MAG: CpsD/CapB family tyrosine-protein kinase [Deltaproteobacteria bacterium]|nr:CpsD/CapB family tyrosine-protein kinase [Deltaproteobacteria bacterium]